MLIALSGGESLSASALAEAAGITAQTASFHLSKLRDGGLISVESTGRYRYYQLAGPHIAELLASLASVGPVTAPWLTTPNRSAQDLRFARCCYDHLAGQIGVAIAQGMVNRGLVAKGADQNYQLEDPGLRWFAQQGIEINLENAVGVHRCLDWTERQYHIAGSLGRALLDAFLSWGWLSRSAGSRALKVTALGWTALDHHFGIRQQQGVITVAEPTQAESLPMS